MSKKNKEILISIFVTILVFGFIFVYYDATKNSNTANTSHSYRLNANWEIFLDGHNYENADLDVVVPKQRKNRSVLSMVTTIPEDVDIKNPVLKIYTVNSGYEVYCDYNTLIKHYGILNVATRRIVGSGYSYINLPDDYAGKTLRIRLYVNEDNAFTSITPPEIYDGNYLIRDFVMENIFEIAVNLFLFVFGMSVLPIGLYYSTVNKKFIKLVFVSFFSIFISLWSICEYDIITLFTYNIEVKPYLEYISMCLWALFVLLYFKEGIKDAPIFMKGLFWFTLFSQIIYMIVSAVLQIFNIVHFPKMLFGEHIIVILICLNMIIDTVYGIRSHKHKNKVIVIGLIVFISITVSDVVRFNFEKYVFTDQVFNYISLMYIGALFFVMIQITDFCKDISVAISDDMRKSALKEMAYKDPLTQIGNRRKCDEEFTKLDASNKVVGIICFDLNNLKKTNDIEGHEKGDLLIRSFAEVLDKTFGKGGLVCRMGGDEFTVIFPNMKGIDIDKLFDNLKENIQKKNEDVPGLNISTAYGFCDNSVNREWKSMDVYKEADKRMYEHKMSMKMQRM